MATMEARLLLGLFQLLILEGYRFPVYMPLLKDCQFGLSPVNYSDSDTVYSDRGTVTECNDLKWHIQRLSSCDFSESICGFTYFHTIKNPGSKHEDGIDASKIDRSSDCSIKCHKDVYGPCKHAVPARLIDLAVQKVATRHLCANLKAIKACDKELSSSNCNSAMFRSREKVDNMLESPQSDYVAYRHAYCRMAKNYKSCVPSLQLGANTNCTQDLANTVFNYFKITLNLTACGIKQEMPEFALYGGPVVCNNPPMLG